jgi:Holliday junction resolvase RusA-like endonuclease
MSQVYRFDVLGVPSPQGSKVAFKDRAGNARMKEDSSGGLKLWRSAVADVARVQRGDRPVLDGPLYVSIDFRFPMPKSRPASVRAAGMAWKAAKPDIDKIVRATYDAMKHGGMIADDSLIVLDHHRKVEVWQQWTGATITVHTLPAVPTP